MALPREILDQLLSGYLDDALSADERARVERILETDAEAARELEELREIRTSLKGLAKVDSGVKLPEGFADRVLDAAVATAKSEGLGEDHPLVKLAEQPSMATSSRGHGTIQWRAASVLVALAASIVIAVFVMLPDNPPVVPGGGEIAAVDPDQAPVEGTDPVAVPDETAIAVVEQPKIDQDSVAQNNDPVAEKDPIENVAMVDPTPTVGPEVDPVPAVDPTQTVDPVAPKGNENNALVSNDPRAAKQVLAVLALDVRRTEAGRSIDAIGEAMKAAKLDATSEKDVSEEMVKIALKASDAGETDGVKVLFLQAPAKRLDLFINRLVSDQLNIESAQFTIVDNVNVVNAANAFLKVEPTRIKSISWELASNDGFVGALASEIGQSTFAPIDAASAAVGLSSAAAAMGGAVSEGEDELSELFLLVR